MSETKWKEPQVTLSRIYTRTGDDGLTQLVGGQRVSKSDLRIACYGTVDELNSFVGAARVTAEALLPDHAGLQSFIAILKRIQHELFNLGSILATKPEDVGPQQPRVTEAEISALEKEIDQANANLPTLRSFVLPGGNRLDADMHICRTVCRRAERLLVELAQSEQVPTDAIQYLNRLSDALFVWGRWANHILGTPETLWEPNAAASAAQLS